MRIIVSKEILQNEKDAETKIKLFLQEKKIPRKWAVNTINGSYVFEYIDSGNVNLFGDVNDNYLEMIIRKD